MSTAQQEQTPTAGEFLPNGLHTPTLDFAFFVVGLLRDREAARLNDGIAGAKKAEDPEKAVKEIMREALSWSAVSAVLSVIEEARSVAKDEVEAALPMVPKARERFEQERAKRDALLADAFVNMRPPRDERDIN